MVLLQHQLQGFISHQNFLAKIEKKGIHIVPVVLHIGLGTFRPVEVEDLTKHKMDSEYFEITHESAEIINKAIMDKHNVFVSRNKHCTCTGNKRYG